MKIPTTDAKLLRDLASATAPERWAEFLAAYRGPMLEYLRGSFPGVDADDMVQETLLAVAAQLPGLGVEVNKDLVIEENKNPHNWKNPVWRHADGSVAEW